MSTLARAEAPPLPPRRSLSVRVGRIGGVPVVVHASHVVPAAILAVVFYGVAAPWPSRAAVTAATMVTVLASLLAHELGHGVVARRVGVPVTEYGFGVAGAYMRPAGPYPSLRAAAWTLAAGPAVSLALAAVLLLATALLRAGDGDPVVEAVCLLAATMNLLLGLVNLVPVRPFDGGRLLEVAVLAASGDAPIAARWSAWVSGCMSLGVIVAGVIALASGAGEWLLAVVLGVALLVLNVGGQLVGAGLSVKVAGYEAPPPTREHAATRV